MDDIATVPSVDKPEAVALRDGVSYSWCDSEKLQSRSQIANAHVSPKARLARNASFGKGFEEYVAETQGETLNRGPGQIRVQNELGTYKPDTLSRAEIKGVEYQSVDSQMQVALHNAEPTGQPLRLYVLEDYTTLSDPLQAYENRQLLIILPVRLPV